MTRVLLGTSLDAAAAGSTIEVSGGELHYLKNVRRHVAGDTVQVFDKSGNAFETEIVQIDGKLATLSLKQRISNLAEPTAIHILTAVPREKILDDVVRKLSELGVDRLTPIICERSSVVPGTHRVERWQRIAEQSMRQCRRRRVLEIGVPCGLQQALGELQATHRFILHPTGDVPGGALLSERFSGDMALLIGPEGGFSDAEVTLATEHLFRAMRLGGAILRMETAILVAAVFGIATLGGYDS